MMMRVMRLMTMSCGEWVRRYGRAFLMVVVVGVGVVVLVVIILVKSGGGSGSGSSSRRSST